MHYPQSIHHRALHQSHERVHGLEERLRISIASEREAEARSTQQATSFAESKARFEQQLTTFAASSARFEQQLTSNRANDERIRQCLRSRHWTEAEIHTLMSPSIPSSSSAVRSSSPNCHPVPMTPSMYALSHGGSATRGPTGNTASKLFIPSKPGDGRSVGFHPASCQRHASSGPWSPPKRETGAPRRSFFDFQGYGSRTRGPEGVLSSHRG